MAEQASGPPPRLSGAGLAATAFHAAVFIWALFSIEAASSGQVVTHRFDWAPSLGLSIGFLIDGLSLTFLLLISGIGALVALYSSRYMATSPQRGRFFLFLTIFSIGMLGLILAADLLSLFVFWEVTTIASYLLVGYNHANEAARRSALQALLVTGGGGLALLAGFILIHQVTGSFDLDVVLGFSGSMQTDALYAPILILVLLGAFTKSAQVPFHFWLPNAMAAPTPISAFLHSATMVKAGIYLMARFHPILSGTPEWTWTLTIFGAATSLFASFMAFRQTDLKQMLAYTTLMALGTLTMFLGGESTIAIAAAATFLIVHSLYKAALFLAVGAIDHATGVRDINKLGGLSTALPFISVAVLVSAFSMAGFPPFLGFIGKELKYEGALAIASEPMLVVAVAVLSNGLMAALAGVIAVKPFFRRRDLDPEAWTPARGPTPWPMWIGPMALGACGLMFGLAPGLLDSILVQPAVTAIAGRPVTVELKLWHGVNVPLMLSIMTVCLGGLFYLRHNQVRAFFARLMGAWPINADRTWDRFLVAMIAFASWQTQVLQGGLQRRYLLTTFIAIGLMIGGTLIYTGAFVAPEGLTGLRFKEWAIIGLIAFGAVLACIAQSWLMAIIALSMVGLGAALTFVTFAAPDVAITQLLVETLTVVLVAVVMLRLPALVIDKPVSRSWQVLRIATSVLLGVVTATVLLNVVDLPFDRRLTDFFEITSVPEAYGRNIVNVILVDFRALDTFGEIAVVAIAAISAYALIRRPGKEGSGS